VDLKVLVIKRLAVEPDLRNRRIATELMTFAEGYAAEDGYTTIRLECYASNQEALNFFANRGYQKAGEVFYPRRILPFKCFEKKL
jgi:ribosomal protein S18 acetylase RimI-like enzyme